MCFLTASNRGCASFDMARLLSSASTSAGLIWVFAVATFMGFSAPEVAGCPRLCPRWDFPQMRPAPFTPPEWRGRILLEEPGQGECDEGPLWRRWREARGPCRARRDRPATPQPRQ